MPRSEEVCLSSTSAFVESQGKDRRGQPGLLFSEMSILRSCLKRKPRWNQVSLPTLWQKRSFRCGGRNEFARTFRGQTDSFLRSLLGGEVLPKRAISSQEEQFLRSDSEKSALTIKPEAYYQSTERIRHSFKLSQGCVSTNRISMVGCLTPSRSTSSGISGTDL